MGLDKDDAVVRRRIRQKMEFVAEQAADVEPTDAELKAFVAEQPEWFQSETRFSFDQIYFCVEAFGRPPKAMLLELRLNAVRRALTHPSSERTVTTVASRFGFWYFGEFSGEYKRQFGELPSVTLAKTLGTNQALGARAH